MTVSVQISRRVIAAAGGWSNPLTHTFLLENVTHLEVWADDVRLTLGVDYSVAGVSDPAGYQVNITSPGSWTPQTFALVVNYPIDQPSDVDLGGQFGARFEAALDRIARGMQSLDDRTRRALKLPFDQPVDQEISFSNDIPDDHFAKYSATLKRWVDGGSSADIINASALAAQVAADRIQTGLDRIAAANSAGAAVDAAQFVADTLDDISAAMAKANTAVQPARTISAGDGLTGGGDLSADRSLALSAASIASLGKADSAVQPTRVIDTTARLTGGGDLSADRMLDLSAAVIASLAKADTALQPGSSNGTYKNVKDYGAVGNGVADDTAAIQAAINTCASGGTVYLPAGQYKTTAQINIPYNGVQLIGDSSSGTVIRPATVGQNVFAMEKPLNASIEYCSIRHMRIEPTAQVNRCLIINNHYWCMVEDVVFAGSHNVGIEVYRGSVAYNLVFKDVLVNSSTENGCILGFTNTGLVQNVIMLNACFNGSAGNGLAIYQCGGLLWINGETLGCNVGMYVRPGNATEWVKGLYIANVFFDTTTSDCVQLFIGSNVGNIINYCTFTNCSFNASVNANGVNIAGVVSRIGNISNISFVGCHWTINKLNGVYATFCTKLAFTACHFISNNIAAAAGTHGLSLDRVDGAQVIGGASGPSSEFPTASQKYGVAIGTLATNVSVIGMDVRGNVTGGILDGSKVASVKDNPGHKTYARGIASIGTGASSVVINHGLAIRPPDLFVRLQALTNPATVGGGQMYATNLTATQFTANISAAVSAGTLYFFWEITAETGTI